MERQIVVVVVEEKNVDFAFLSGGEGVDVRLGADSGGFDLRGGDGLLGS